MSYVPPHKRVSKTVDAPPPTPARMIPQFKKSLNLKSSSRHGSDQRKDKSKPFAPKIVYANNSTSRWLAVPSMDDVQPSSLRLVPVCHDHESVGRKSGVKQLTLVNIHLQEHRDIKSYELEHMWAPIVEILHADLLSAIENIRNELVDQISKPKLVARFGKVLFRWNPKHDLDSSKENSVSESFIKDLRRSFYTTVPIDYTEHIKNVVVPELSVQSKEEKEQFQVKLADAKRPDSTITCKCRVKEDEKRLELYKIELSPVRHLVEDISCLESNLDLRLALWTKKIVIDFQDEEMQAIRDLISSAIFDPNVKGGLRWPLGKANSGGQYSVVAIWHTKTEAYNSSSTRLKLREANRFDFRETAGEVTREVNLMLTGLIKNLEQKCDGGSILAMLEDAIMLIQNNFLAWDGSVLPCTES